MKDIFTISTILTLYLVRWKVLGNKCDKLRYKNRVSYRYRDPQVKHYFRPMKSMRNSDQLKVIALIRKNPFIIEIPHICGSHYQQYTYMWVTLSAIGCDFVAMTHSLSSNWHERAAFQSVGVRAVDWQ